jgi:hypothetical protein
MHRQLDLLMLPQPDDRTCGPTCLHAVYRYYDDVLPLETVIAEVDHLPDGGTLAVMLGCHALRRGYRATIYTYNLQMFDPTWFGSNSTDLREKLIAQAQAKAIEKLRLATEKYLEFLDLGGAVRFEDLTTRLIRRYLVRGVPVITGLSTTYLHRSPREYGPRDEEDDIRGYPAGHFVVFHGYDRRKRTVLVADPMHPNPLGPGQNYAVSIERVLGAVFLGVLTYDANLLIIEPPPVHKGQTRVPADRG